MLAFQNTVESCLSAMFPVHHDKGACSVHKRFAFKHLIFLLGSLRLHWVGLRRHQCDVDVHAGC